VRYIILSLFLIFISACSATESSSNEQLEEDLTTTTIENIDIKEDESKSLEEELLMSDNFTSYYEGLTVSEGPDFKVQIVSDFDIIDENVYIITGLYEGMVYKYNPETIEIQLFLDISKNLIITEDKNNEMGLLSIEFHPTSDYFLISYVNKSMKLIVEQYFFDRETLIVDDTEPNEIISIEYFDKVHFSGNLLYSQYYDGFIFSAGDGLGDQLGLRGDSIYSYINRGKILLLLASKNNNIVNPTISYGITENKNTILAYGVRNPWGIGIINDHLYIPDVGRTTYEEVSILELSNTVSKFLGYPIYEGPENTNFELKEIYSWDSGAKSSIDDYLNENYLSPEIFYKHSESKYGYRCAVIGGAAIENINNDTWNNTFSFVDYCSKELFTYNYSEKKLISSLISPLDVDNLYISKLAYLDQLSFILLGFTYEVKDGEYFVENKNFIIELPKIPFYLGK
tara:strand:- start:356 stop:1723 length:1368 start_codon:yes stop_codon:yes gene_type:complete